MQRCGTLVRAKYAADTRDGSCVRPELLASPLPLPLPVKFCSCSSHRTSSRTRHMRASRRLCVCVCVRTWGLRVSVGTWWWGALQADCEWPVAAVSTSCMRGRCRRDTDVCAREQALSGQ